ncbi:CIC11C00000005480 [Sungouiella intermedia]|uniref:Palmitoyltransferase n=1 Tax=Sungouiella intermedia TaxID=45354 RepID=A0A1L0D2I9_9ASCO|nr:CIC11C00000005480 [[Candida] intermedia]
MLLILLLILLLALVVAIVLFGDSPNFRNTPIQSFHHFLLRTNASISRRIMANDQIYAALRWLVPLFYVMVVLFCLFEFFSWVYPALDSDILNSQLHSAYIAFTIASVFLSTALVTFSDPGTVNSANVAAACAKFKDNGLIFFGKTCSTCHTYKPARSKHCSVCNRCVLLFDHHCIWFNNCIGYNNYRWFIAFLLSNINMMVYGAYLCWLELRQLNAPNGWWKLIVATTENNRISGILLLLASIISVITSLFTCLHLRYLYLGVTTNEAEKWGEIEHLVSLGVLFYVVERDIYVEEASMRQADGTYEVVYLRLNDDQVVFKGKGDLTFLKITLMENDLNNIYDGGFVNNVKERIFI